MSKDIIYREDAINLLWYFQDECCSAVVGDFEKLPSADRPQGKWIKFGLGRGTRILFCTNCERRIEVPLSQGDSNYDFCPNCGAKMKGAEDD